MSSLESPRHFYYRHETGVVSIGELDILAAALKDGGIPAANGQVVSDAHGTHVEVVVSKQVDSKTLMRLGLYAFEGGSNPNLGVEIQH